MRDFRREEGSEMAHSSATSISTSIKRRLVQLHGTKNARYDVTNKLSTIKFVGDYFCQRFLTTMLINRCTPLSTDEHLKLIQNETQNGL